MIFNFVHDNQHILNLEQSAQDQGIYNTFYIDKEGPRRKSMYSTKSSVYCIWINRHLKRIDAKRFRTKMNLSITKH
jgi:hypothetical protein